MMDYAGDRLKHLHIADVFDHTANVGNRYIMNPPGVDARIHQHNEIGNGEIDWDDAFAYLREREYDAPASVCVVGGEEDAAASTIRLPARMLKVLGGDWPRSAGASAGIDPSADRPVGRRPCPLTAAKEHPCATSASAW